MLLSPPPEQMLRLAVMLGVFAVMALWEVAAPARAPVVGRRGRWLTNWTLAAADAAVLRVAMPAAAVGAAAQAEAHGFGLFHWLAVPAVPAGVAAFVALDGAVWAQHVAFHKVPLLWRAHAVHHADVDLDVTSGLRFHPLEAVLSMALKMAVAALLGAPPAAVFAFETVLNAASQFSHANVALPAGLERYLRRMLVTPDMHRIHHSVVRREADSNYGFCLSVWDRLFGVYTARPAAGPDGLVIGLDAHRHDGPTRILWSLLLPFRPPRQEPRHPGPRAPTGVKGRPRWD